MQDRRHLQQGKLPQAYQMPALARRLLSLPLSLDRLDLIAGGAPRPCRCRGACAQQKRMAVTEAAGARASCCAPQATSAAHAPAQPPPTAVMGCTPARCAARCAPESRAGLLRRADRRCRAHSTNAASMSALILPERISLLPASAGLQSLCVDKCGPGAGGCVCPADAPGCDRDNGQCRVSSVQPLQPHGPFAS